MRNCDVNMLKKMTFDKHIKPDIFIDGQIKTKVDNWTELTLVFVKWLISNNYINASKLPVNIAAGSDKYYINSRPYHLKGKGVWKEVGSYYVDVKYNAKNHIDNMLSALNQLGVSDPSFLISFHPD